jgi:hypothetical protein
MEKQNFNLGEAVTLIRGTIRSSPVSVQPNSEIIFIYWLTGFTVAKTFFDGSSLPVKKRR